MLGQLIRTIRVSDLFGLYTYILPEGDQGLQDAAILYGDNGVGKSTVLRLVFNLLSSAEKKNHRTALTKVPYKKLEVELTSGITLKVSRDKDIDSTSIVLSINKGEQTLAGWSFDSSEHTAPEEMLEREGMAIRRLNDGKYVIVHAEHRSKSKKAYPYGQAAYMTEMKKHVPTVFLLNADRRLDSDAVADPSDEVELRRMLRYEDPRRLGDLVVRSREIALSQALSSAARWIGRHAVQGANRGSTNVHSVYVNVLRHLGAATHRQSATDSEASLATLRLKLSEIARRSAELAKYEFTPALSTEDFAKALQVRAKSKRNLAVSLLKPYVDSLEGRLQALDAVYKTVDSFVTIINDFLGDKAISFKLSTGFLIQNRLGHDLGARQLSSGEQQLLLLFCYVLTARDQPSVFIIDEPEISLNVKWQRMLVQALLDITKDADVQFVFASHSMELLAQHRSRVVVLRAPNG